MNDVQSFEKAIRDSMDYADGEDTFESVIERLQNGLMQGWTVGSVSLVTCVVKYETHCKVRICYCGGTLTPENTKEALAKVEAFARALGATGVEIFGRRGWARQLRALGYNEKYTVVVKRLEEES